jgi:hypothetical protein
VEIGIAYCQKELQGKDKKFSWAYRPTPARLFSVRSSTRWCAFRYSTWQRTRKRCCVRSVTTEQEPNEVWDVNDGSEHGVGPRHLRTSVSMAERGLDPERVRQIREEYVGVLSETDAA